MTLSSEQRPLHVWNDPDGDGHDCADCGPESIWKCDEAAHFPTNPYGLLTEDQRRDLADLLDENERVRRLGNAAARNIPL